MNYQYALSTLNNDDVISKTAFVSGMLFSMSNYQIDNHSKTRYEDILNYPISHFINGSLHGIIYSFTVNFIACRVPLYIKPFIPIMVVTSSVYQFGKLFKKYENLKKRPKRSNLLSIVSLHPLHK